MAAYCGIGFASSSIAWHVCVGRLRIARIRRTLGRAAASLRANRLSQGPTVLIRFALV